jgi:hypothetical protein
MRVKTYQLALWPCCAAVVTFLLIGKGATSDSELAARMWLVGAAALWMLAWLYAISHSTWRCVGIWAVLFSTVAVSVILSSLSVSFRSLFWSGASLLVAFAWFYRSRIFARKAR